VQAQRDHVAQADLALERVGRAVGQDPAGLDEPDLVTQLLGLAHVVRGEDDRHSPLAPECSDVMTHAHRDVGVEAERGLVEEQQLGIVHERLGQRHALLEAGGQLVVPDAAVRRQLVLLDQPVHATAKGPAGEAVEAAIERHDLVNPETPQERRSAAGHVEPAPHARRLAHHVVAEHAHLPAVGRQQRAQDRQQRGLARAVRPQQPEDGAALDGQRDSAQRDGLAPAQPARTERLGDLPSLDGKRVRRNGGHALNGTMRRMADPGAEVAEANARFYRAFEALDVSAMDEACARGKRDNWVPPGWRLLTGWDAVRESWARIFENTAEMRFTISDVQVVVSEDTGWVTCTENILSEVQGRVSGPKILATNLFERQPGGWRMVHHHGSHILAAGHPPPRRTSKPASAALPRG